MRHKQPDFSGCQHTRPNPQSRDSSLHQDPIGDLPPKDVTCERREKEEKGNKHTSQEGSTKSIPRLERETLATHRLTSSSSLSIILSHPAPSIYDQLHLQSLITQKARERQHTREDNGTRRREEIFHQPREIRRRNTKRRPL